jgi:uncharacterized protein YdhG (YjbR/CyaY superfamily)
MKLTGRSIKAGGVAKYIQRAPTHTREALLKVRKAIQEVAPDAIETMSYFEMPGYSYPGYEYNGMFAWFSLKDGFVRLHVRPEALILNSKWTAKYKKTRAIICFPVDEEIPVGLVKKLVKASLKSMKRNSKQS